MKRFSRFQMAALALLGVVCLAAPQMLATSVPARAESGHDHGKGHSDGDGHKHDAMKEGDGHAHGDKHHDGGHEKAKDHAKHHPEPAHGGVVLELDDHHGELVVADGKLALFMSDHDGHKTSAKGFSATAMIITAQGRHGPLTLASVGDNKLETAMPAKVGPGARVIITLKDPHGHMSQARYQMP